MSALQRGDTPNDGMQPTPRSGAADAWRLGEQPVMGRKMSPEREAEFAELERFLAHFATRVKGIDRAQSTHPSNTLVEITAKFGKCKALESLRQAIDDCTEMTQDRRSDWIREFDAECAALGLVTLSQLRVRYWAKYKAILKRRRIRTKRCTTLSQA